MILSIRGIKFSYGKDEVLRSIKFQADGGEVVAILGKNGSGKSTLLKTINRILRPHGGTVLIDGADLAKMGKKELAKRIGYMPQKSNGVPCTVFEAILLGRRPHIKWNITERDLAVAQEIVGLLRLEKYTMRYTYELSGGELQKVILARALAQEPQILLLDEPINHLDMKNQLEVMTLLHHITKKLKVASLIVMHDVNNALRFADKFLMIKDGEIIACGGKDVINSENIKSAFNLDVTVGEIGGITVIVPIFHA